MIQHSNHAYKTHKSVAWDKKCTLFNGFLNFEHILYVFT